MESRIRSTLFVAAVAGLALACSGGAGSQGASASASRGGNGSSSSNGNGGDPNDDGDDQGGDHDAGASADSRVAIGLRIAPVPLNLDGKPVGKVGLGSYIVNAQGGCNDCHTNPPYAAGGNPYQGQQMMVNAAHYLAGGMAFGPFTSKNITPDASGKPAGLTLDQFVHLMRTGVDPSDNQILQVMPWPVYGQMRDKDLEAVWWYLSAIPHAEPAPPTTP